MADLTFDTTAPAYTTRRTQFADIVQFWNPRLELYVQLTPAQQQQWRDQDPFLDDIIRWVEKITNEGKGAFV